MIEIIFLFLLFISFLGYILWGQSKTGWRFEIMPVVVICGHVLFLYLGSLFHLLYLSSIFLFITGLAMFVYLFFFSNRTKTIGHIKGSPAFFYILTFAFFLSWFFANGKLITRWDEFSHWGLVIKTMVLTDALPTSTSSVYALTYPVGTGLFQYYVTRVLQAFQTVSSYPLADEGKAYFGNYLFLGLPLFVLLSNFRKESVFYFLPLLFGCFFLNFLGMPNGANGFTFYSLYPDGLLGILYGVGLILLLSDSGKYTIRGVIPISLIASTLVLLKPVGIFFSVFVVLPVAFFILYRLIKQRGDYRFSEIKKDRTLLAYSGVFLLLLALPFVTYLSWTWHVKNIATNLTSSINFNLAEEIESRTQVLSAPGTVQDDNDALLFIRQVVPSRERILIREYGKAMHTRLIGFTDLTTTKLILIYLVLIPVSILFSNNNRRKLLALNVFVLIGFFAYNLLLLFLYRYLFGEEGKQIPSFGRYISSYLLGWGMFIFYCLFQPIATMEEGVWTRKTVFSLALTTLIISIPLVNIPSGYINVTLGMPDKRVQARALLDEFAPAMEPNSRIYHIDQGHLGGLYHFIVRLEAIPRYTQFDGWSLGRRYKRKDINTRNYKPEEWFALLRDGKYDYVLISHADSQFWSKYGELFIGQSEEDIPQLFEVGDAKLIRIK